MRAWKQSGETAAVFAASCGVAPRTLTWWKWRLGNRADTPTVDEAEPRLVPLHVEPSSARAEAPAAWELTTARGDVLRVYATTPAPELVTIVQTLVDARGRR